MRKLLARPSPAMAAAPRNTVTLRRVVSVFLAVATTAALSAVPASANDSQTRATGTATVIKRLPTNALQVDAALGVQNAIFVRLPDWTAWKIVDAGAPLQLDPSAEATCELTATNAALCDYKAPAVLTASTFDRSDRVDVRGPMSSTIMGGSADDRLTGGSVNDALYGEEGNDILTGGLGNDDLFGGDHADVMDGGRGADDFDGGAGSDLATFEGRTDELEVTLDGNADDGGVLDASAGRRDNVMANVEQLTGGEADDLLVGSAWTNVITGGLGADTIFGRGSNDWIFVAGDGTADEVNCGGGSDFIRHDPALDVFETTGVFACETTDP